MDFPSKGSQETHRGDVQKGYQHCLKNREVQSKLLSLKKENELLKEEKQEWLTEQRKYIVKLGEFSDDKTQLKIKLKEEEEKLNHLTLELQKVSEEKNNVIRLLELQVKRAYEENNKLKENLKDDSHDKLKILEEEKQLLESQLKIFSEENNKLSTLIKTKSDTIRRFVNQQVNVIKSSDKKMMEKLCKKFNFLGHSVKAYHSNRIHLMKDLYDVQQACQNCRTSALQGKEYYEGKIKQLEIEHLNMKFLLEQQSNLINQLKQECEKLKRKLKEARKEKYCNKEDPKLGKEKGDILLPPTPDSWSTSQDTSSEDVSFEIYQSNICLRSMLDLDSLESNKKIENGNEIWKTVNREKFSKANAPYLDTQTSEFKKTSAIKAEKNQAENPIPVKIKTTKEKIEKFKCGDDCIIDNFDNTTIQEESGKNISGVPLKNAGDLEKSKSLEISSNESVNKVCLSPSSITFSESNELSIQKSLISDFKHISTTELSEKPVNERVKQPSECVETIYERNKNPYLFPTDDMKSVIGSEGWSPIHELESNDFEPSLSQLAQFPNIISPFRSMEDESTRISCDMESFNSNRHKSIFSPITNSNTQCETTKIDTDTKTKTVIKNENDVLINMSKPVHISSSDSIVEITHSFRNISEIKNSGKDCDKKELAKPVNKLDYDIKPLNFEMAGFQQNYKLVNENSSEDTQVSNEINDRSLKSMSIKRKKYDLEDANVTLSPGKSIASPQTNSTTILSPKSPVSPRSPTGLDRYNLRLSPKAKKYWHCDEISPRKSGSLSKNSPQKEIKIPKFSLNENSKGTAKKESSMSPVTVSGAKCSYFSIHSPPRSPESKKNYNMRSVIPRKKRNCCDSGVEVTRSKVVKIETPTSSVAHTESCTPFTHKKSSVLSNSASDHADVLAEIAAKSYKDDSDPLEPKLKLTSQERIKKLTEQGFSLNPVEISITCNGTNDISIGKSMCRIPTLVPANSVQSEKLNINISNYKISDKVSKSNNILTSSSHSVNFFKQSQPSKAHRTFTKSQKCKSSNDLQVTDSKSKEPFVTKEAHSSQIDVTPVHKSKTTTSEQTLLMVSDLTFKTLSYRNCLFNEKIQIVKPDGENETGLKKKSLSKKLLNVLNSCRKDCVYDQKMPISSQSKVIIKKQFKKKMFRKHLNKFLTSKRKLDSNMMLKINSKPSKFENECNNKSVRSASTGQKDHIASEVSKSIAHKTINTPLVNVDNEIPVEGFNETYQSSEYQTKVITLETEAKINESNNVPCHESKLDEETDCLVIDIDENLSDIDSDCGPKVAKNNLDFRNLETNKTKTSDMINSSCIIPNYQPMPEAMCKYKENLVKTNTDFSSPENKVKRAFQVKSEIASEHQNNSSKMAFKPHFYTEHQNSVNENPQSSDVIQDCQIEEETRGVNHFSNLTHKLKTLDELIPKGTKTKVIESVLRTALYKHKEDLSKYQERNRLEKRVPEKGVPGHLTAKVQELVKSFLLEDLKSENDLISVVDELKQYTIRVIVKGVLLALYGLASEVTAGSLELIWMSDWDVPQMPSKKSPFVHPKIQSIFLLLNYLIASFTSDKSEDEKKKFVEEELTFIEQVCIGGIPDFSLSMHEFWLNVGFLYTLLARQYSSMARVRQLMYDMLYCFTKRALVVSLAIIQTWPNILQARSKHHYKGDLLMLVISQQLTAKMFTPFHSKPLILSLVQKLQDLMWRKYRFRSNIINSDELFDLCFQNLHQSGVYEALVILFKRQPRDWFKQRPFQQLITVVESWCEAEDEVSTVRAVVAINVICSSLKCYKTTEIQPEITKVFNVFQNILSNKNSPPWLQEIIVLNACHLTRLNFNKVVDLIVSWRPAEVSQNVIDQILVDVIGRRSPQWWVTHQVARFYLCQR